MQFVHRVLPTQAMFLHLYIKSLTLTNNNILSKYVFCARRQGRCKLSSPGQPCEVGLRRRHYYILGGSVLGVWTHLEGVLGRHSSHNSRMQIARVQTSWKRLVGESVTVGIVFCERMRFAYSIDLRTSL